jgi:hypothetical protein
MNREPIVVEHVLPHSTTMHLTLSLGFIVGLRLILKAIKVYVYLAVYAQAIRLFPKCLESPSTEH